MEIEEGKKKYFVEAVQLLEQTLEDTITTFPEYFNENRKDAEATDKRYWNIAQ